MYSLKQIPTESNGVDCFVDYNCFMCGLFFNLHVEEGKEWFREALLMNG